MGLLDAVGAGLNVAAEQSAKVGLDYFHSIIQEERDARLNEMRNQSDLMTRDRNKTDAAEERGRVASEAQVIADKRGGLLSQSATDAYTKFGETDPEGAKLGLDAVAAAKADGGYAQTPTTRDMMMAKGDYAGVANLEEKDADNTRADKAQVSADTRNDRDFKLRESELKIRAAAEGRLAKGTNLDNEIKQIKLDNAKRVNTLKDEFKDATPERKAQINEEIQVLTGQDNDKYLPMPTKDAEGNITGYKVFDTKRGEFVEPKAQSQGKTGRPPLGSFDKSQTEQKKAAAPNPSANHDAESTPRKGLIASARETFGEGGTMQSSATDARERALLPQIKAKIDRGYKLTAEESMIADRLKLR